MREGARRHTVPFPLHLTTGSIHPPLPKECILHVLIIVCYVLRTVQGLAAAVCLEDTLCDGFFSDRTNNHVLNGHVKPPVKCTCSNSD